MISRIRLPVYSKCRASEMLYTNKCSVSKNAVAHHAILHCLCLPIYNLKKFTIQCYILVEHDIAMSSCQIKHACVHLMTDNKVDSTLYLHAVNM